MGSSEDRRSCSLCSSDQLDPCARLLPTPLANEFPLPGDPPQEIFPLELIMCRACGHVQTSIIVDPARLFGQYLYQTSTSTVTIEHLRGEANAILARVAEEDAGRGWPRASAPRFLLEVGSNDGAFLREIISLGVKQPYVLGVEPSKTMSAKAQADGLPTLPAFFGPGMEIQAALPASDKWHVVVGNNVLAHVPSVGSVLDEVAARLEPDGFLVMEVGPASDVMSGAFDLIYHEHTSYHALAPLRRALEDRDIPMFDVERTAREVGRGSLRVWAGKGRNPTMRMLDALLEEEALKLDDPREWGRLLGRRSSGHVAAATRRLHAYFNSWRGVGNRRPPRSNPSVAGYGAPAKMTTLIHACDLPDVDFVAEDSPWKIGRLTPGRRVPIVPTAELLEKKPGAVIVFAWNFANEIAAGLRKKKYKGEIYVPMPEGKARVL